MIDTVDAQRIFNTVAPRYGELDAREKSFFVEAILWALDPEKQGQFILHKDKDGKVVKREIRDFRSA